MASKKSPSIFGTLQKTADNAAAVNGEFVRQLRVDALEENPMNRFSMAEDAQFQATMDSVEKDGFLEDIIVTPAEAEGKYRIISGHRRVRAAKKLGKVTVPCKVRHYHDRLEELRALMGTNLHRRNVSPFDMARQLETLREVLREEEMIHPDRLLIPCWEGEPVRVYADPGLMKQLLRILMDNSLKYSPPEGRVYLRVSHNQGYARVTVQDEGMGIPPDGIPHIFERFYRTDQSRDRKTGGTGLGLSIAKWIVDRHGGWFEVVSRVDVGTRITFLIPLKEDKPGSASTEG